MQLVAKTVFTGDRVLSPGLVTIEDGRVLSAEITSGLPVGAIDLGDVTIVPGFVDQHSHGGGGASFTEGAQAARKVLATHLAHGTTSMVASLVTDTLGELENQVEALSPLVESGDLLGVHLEGPWLAEKYKGAHQLSLLRDPNPQEVARLCQVGKVVMVTLAVEREGGQEAVKWMSENGVIAAPGHTDASYDQASQAFSNGAKVITHLFNAMRPIHHRDPGPIMAALNTDGVVVELIADGIHLHAGVVKAVFDKKGRDTVLVTDAMAAAGAPDGEYLLGPLGVTVKDGVARLTEGGAIAGSTLTLDRAVKFCVERAGINLFDAVRAATTRPAEVLGISDIGRLSPGSHADLAILGQNLDVLGVMRRGKWVGSQHGKK